MIEETFHQNHDLHDHLEIRHIYLIIQFHYYFPWIFYQVKIYYNEYMIYQISKSSNKSPLDQAHFISIDESLHTLSMNFIIDLSLSNDKNALLTFTDKFTKVIQLVSCNKTTSVEDIAHLYLHHCYSIFDLSIKFISNHDTRFISRFWRTLMKLLNIQKEMTSIFHFNTDDQAKKINQIVEIDLRYFLEDEINEYSNWTEYLSILKYEYNSMKHESTSYTSNELYYIIPSRGISDLTISSRLSSKSAESLVEQLKNARDDVKDSLIIAQKK